MRSFLENNFSLGYLSEKLNYDTSFDGFGSLPPPPKPIIGVEESGPDCANGYKLGDTDEYQNCAKICEGAQYEYKFITRHVSINGVEIYGSWCLPKPIAQCNLNTSRAIIGPTGYQCITAFPELLGGSTGNEIVGCTPQHKFIDNKTMNVYNKFTPTNIVINDINEMYGSKFRYECFAENNKYAAVSDKIGSRFDYDVNVCSSFDETGFFDRGTGHCICQVTNPPERKYDVCTTCTSGFEIIDEHLPQHGSMYGYSHGIHCVDPLNAGYYESRRSGRPCGIHTIERIRRNGQSYGCERALVNATTSYTPSVLEYIQNTI